MRSKIEKRNRLNKLYVQKHFGKFKWCPDFELASSTSENFYKSTLWMKTRYMALDRFGRKCKSCGATQETAELHVDHIRPRYLYPERAFDLRNLQILCKPCNLAKGLRSDDFRPKTILRRNGKDIKES